MRDLEHVSEIDRVLKGYETGRDGLVSESWRRCVQTYGMDPARPEPAHIVTEQQLREHQEQSERLIATARSGLRTLFKQVAGHNYVLLLADAKGVCVDFFGDPRFEDDLRQAGLYLGSDWSEDLAGTCGVGSCIVTGEAVTIHQSDHFGLSHTPLSCTAAPIYDTCGKLAAVLDISLLRSPSPKSSQNLAMNLVKASTRRVEMANLMATTRKEWVLRFSTSPEFLEVDPEAAIALDDSGRITGMTHGALACLAPTGSTDLIGSRIDMYLDLDVDDLPSLMRGRPAEDRVLRRRDGGGLYGHAIAPQAARMARSPVSGTLPTPLRGICGQDATLSQVVSKVARLAPTQVPILLSGETGTGKEYLARAIHVLGPADRSFHTLCCSALKPEKVGALSDAAAGTLFLRGIEDLDVAGQAALLALLEHRSDLRVVATTRQDPAGSTSIRALRPELYFRLAGSLIRIPPLRHRQDFDWLVDRLLRRSPRDLRLSPSARAELSGRHWPGNIRELATLLDVATALAETDVIDLTDLPQASLSRRVETDPKQDLEALLDACGWNMSHVARRLGVNRSTVLRRMRSLGLEPHPKPRA
ncbi:acetoin catabolism regulatory protein [Labrenzia sp. C1B10]|uniref:sigma-54-dependent Fis family transcriptional regulator n=1 Tax=unclassified Labrenzia TaxID=2648686 RepID=UPI0003B81431|nr:MULTISPECIES: sigma-54-dependent Fis family transcriptional regulator [unclassified Labrenzia]ERP87252.1 acetoin catabolism regulatory protein [Labrenzia sp. C1B10]